MDAAQTRIFYAFHPDQLYIQRVLANLPAAEQAQLNAAVEVVRKTGYASGVDPRGIAIIAAPVFDNTGLSAALALISTRDALSIDADSRERRVLSRTADELSTELGGVNPLSTATPDVRASS